MIDINSQETIRNIIDSFGFAVQMFGAEDDRPSFAYTIGLTQHDHAELIITGYKTEYMHNILSNLGNQILQGQFLPAYNTYGFFENVPIYILPTDKRKESYLSNVRQIYGNIEDVFQIVIPDANGCFPWQPGYDQQLRDKQVLIGNPPSLH